MDQVKKVLDMMSSFNYPQAMGVAALIFIAKREQTNLYYQRKEWNFSDIPVSLIKCIDALDEDQQFAIASRIILEFAEDDPTAPDSSDSIRHFTNLLPLNPLQS